MTIDDRSSLFHLENAASMYLKEGEAKPGQQGQGIQVTANVDADFFVLVGILFNAVTGNGLVSDFLYLMHSFQELWRAPAGLGT